MAIVRLTDSVVQRQLLLPAEAANLSIKRRCIEQQQEIHIAWLGIVEWALLVPSHRPEENDRQRFGMLRRQRLDHVGYTNCGHRIEPGNHWHDRSRQMRRGL